jgi:hypothetical protein
MIAENLRCLYFFRCLPRVLCVPQGSRTFIDYASLDELFQGIVAMFESALKLRTPDRLLHVYNVSVAITTPPARTHTAWHAAHL